MNTRLDPRELAEAVMRRSVCHVQVGAVIYDRTGPFSWGWNGPGHNGLGLHAEVMAMRRANPDRLWGATIAVASRWKKHGKVAPSKPCDACAAAIQAVGLRVTFRDVNGWHSHGERTGPAVGNRLLTIKEAVALMMQANKVPASGINRRFV